MVPKSINRKGLNTAATQLPSNPTRSRLTSSMRLATEHIVLASGDAAIVT